MWRTHGISEISKNEAGFYFFKFKSEEGMKFVLESGPWLVDNVPLILNKWQPGECVVKADHKKVSLWVSIYNVPLELWNGGGIGQIASQIGIPLLMDKVTEERCTLKTGRVNFARVLVEVEANNQIPDEVTLEYPAKEVDGMLIPGRIISLRVGYQWKPSGCTKCCVFGHCIETCKSDIDEIHGNVSGKVTKERVDPDIGFKAVVRRNRFGSKQKNVWQHGGNEMNFGRYKVGRQNANISQHVGAQLRSHENREQKNNIAQERGQFFKGNTSGTKKINQNWIRMQKGAQNNANQEWKIKRK